MDEHERRLMDLLADAHQPNPGQDRCRVCDQPHPCWVRRACTPSR